MPIEASNDYSGTNIYNYGPHGSVEYSDATQFSAPLSFSLTYGTSSRFSASNINTIRI